MLLYYIYIIRNLIIRYSETSQPVIHIYICMIEVSVQCIIFYHLSCLSKLSYSKTLRFQGVHRLQEIVKCVRDLRSYHTSTFSTRNYLRAQLRIKLFLNNSIQSLGTLYADHIFYYFYISIVVQFIIFYIFYITIMCLIFCSQGQCILFTLARVFDVSLLLVVSRYSFILH